MEPCVTEIIPKSFYLLICEQTPESTDSKLYFNVDNIFLYERFFADFGPLNLGQIYRYCLMVRDKLEVASFGKKTLYHQTSTNPHDVVNSILLVLSYQILFNKMDAASSMKMFIQKFPDLIAYRDASFGHNQFPLLVYDCINGLIKATKVGILNFDKFNLEEYEKYEHIKDGDMKWIVPGKLLAFSGPLDVSRGLVGGSSTWTTKQYVHEFKKINVGSVVRLNEKLYDQTQFSNAGIRHHDLYFPDGSTPSERIVREFLSIVDNSYGGVAVHCKAGLGRTGSLIGCYLMSQFQFTAYEAIGYMRLCRPGSVLGNQQYWLCSMEPILTNKIIFQDTIPNNNRKPAASVRSAYKLKPITVISPQINRTSITSASSTKSRLSLQFTSVNSSKFKKPPPRSQTPKTSKAYNTSLNRSKANTSTKSKTSTSMSNSLSSSTHKYPVISQSISYKPTHRY